MLWIKPPPPAPRCMWRQSSRSGSRSGGCLRPGAPSGAGLWPTPATTARRSRTNCARPAGCCSSAVRTGAAASRRYARPNACPTCGRAGCGWTCCSAGLDKPHKTPVRRSRPRRCRIHGVDMLWGAGPPAVTPAPETRPTHPHRSAWAWSPRHSAGHGCLRKVSVSARPWACAGAGMPSSAEMVGAIPPAAGCPGGRSAGCPCPR